MDIVKPIIEHTLYPYMEKRKGNRVRMYTDALRASEHLPQEALAALQRDKLAALLSHCIAHVPAYRGLSLSAEEIRADPYTALARFPVLTRDKFYDVPDPYISEKADRASLIANVSGGSTGEAARFYMDRVTVEHYEAARFRGLSWYDISYGSRSVMIWGNPIELDAAKQRRYFLKEKYLKNRILIPAYRLSPDKMTEYMSLLNRYKPEYIYGYASSLAAFAEMMQADGRELLCPLKAVVSTAETLSDDQRAVIHAAFRCPVVNEYGARDGGNLAYECPAGGMHIPIENTVIDVLDPETHEPLPTGESGVLAVTDLNNFAMPRIRYLLGDVAALSDKICSCGRTLPLLSSISGREDALLVGKNGLLVHGHAISHLARTHTIRHWQLIQHSAQRLCLYVVTGQNDPAHVRNFADEISAMLEGLPAEIKETDRLQLSKSGKFRYTIREFALHR